MQFKCPICFCPEYQRVVVPRPPRAPYETDFFCCLGCSALFLEPELFTAAPAYRQEQEAADTPEEQGPGSNAGVESLRQQARRYRFWKAKAKRELGWWEPTSEQVLAVRDRYRQ